MPIPRHFLFAVVTALLFVSTIDAQRSALNNKPFSLTWTHAQCMHCATARQLGEIRFVSKSQVWAIGDHIYTHGEGYGDFIVVHSSDGGRTWIEVAGTEKHADEPAFTFLDSRNGWLASMTPDGGGFVLRTSDSGTKWKRISDQYLQAMHFFDTTHGYGKEVNRFLRTDDGGRTWTETELTQVKFIDRLLFLSRKTGWIAGSDGNEAVILRTNDGGQHWGQSRVQVAGRVAQIRDLYFTTPLEGWAITWNFNNEGTHLFHTVDGGNSWSGVSGPSFQGEGNWLSVIRPLSNVLYAFGTAGDKPFLAYSTDGGTTWGRSELPRWVYDCQVFAERLQCSARSGESGFWILTVQPTDVR